MRVLVCGGRDYADKDTVTRVLDQLAKKHYDENGGDSDGQNWMPLPSFVIIHGGCNCGPDDPKTGADFWADQWCVCNWINPIVFEAEWYPDGKTLERSAGPKRNSRMLTEGKPDLVVAFPGGRGTADMVRKARAAGITVTEVP